MGRETGAADYAPAAPAPLSVSVYDAFAAGTNAVFNAASAKGAAHVSQQGLIAAGEVLHLDSKQILNLLDVALLSFYCARKRTLHNPIIAASL